MASNQGQLYEKKIRTLLRSQSLMPILLESNLKGNDAGFMHKGIPYFVEIKNKTAPDFGQKGMVWDKSSRKWQWRINDIITDFYNDIGVFKKIDKTFVPHRHSFEPLHKLTLQHKKHDLQKFENAFILKNLDVLYEFYARKNCYYIQIEGKGFYYLKQDIANLNVPRFRPELSLRLRAKTHSSRTIYNYSFFAVIQAKASSMLQSEFDLEEITGKFPPIS